MSIPALYRMASKGGPWTVIAAFAIAFFLGFLVGELDLLHLPSAHRVVRSIEALTEQERNRWEGFERYPYIQDTTPHSFRVCWKFSTESPAILVYGDNLALENRLSEDAVREVHSFELKDLEPNQVYYYQALDPQGRPLTPIEHSQTFPELGSLEDFSFSVLGDSGEPFGILNKVAAGPAQLDIAEQVDRLYPDFVIHTGDLVYPSGQWEGYTPLFFEPYHFFLRRAPVYPCLGNHDVKTDQGAPWRESFFLPENNGRFPEWYYSFDCANAHFTVLDSALYSSLPEGATSVESERHREERRLHQIEWLKEDLASVPPDRWKFVVFHHPMHTTASPADSRDLLIERIIVDWRDVLEQFQVDFALAGHDHVYERFHPLTKGEIDRERGIVYIVTGGGGGDLDSFDSPKSDETAARVSGYHHFVHIRVEGNNVLLEAIDREGNSLDREVYSRSGEAAEPMDLVPSG